MKTSQNHIRNTNSNSTRPLVSIIIPVFNREKHIQQTLESLISDEYHPKEIIVIDDGSNDGSAEIIKRFPGIKYHYQKNQGVAAARNTGIKHATGQYIAFLDSDDIWIPGRLEYSLAYFLDHPGVDYLLGQQQMFLDEGVQKPNYIKQEWLDFPQNGSGTGVLIAKKNCFDKVGLFNQNYPSSEDTEWLLRANEAQLLKARLPILVIKRRIHDSNLSTKLVKKTRGLIFKMMKESVERKKIANA